MIIVFGQNNGEEVRLGQFSSGNAALVNLPL
jgi:hypothetical protein